MVVWYSSRYDDRQHDDRRLQQRGCQGQRGIGGRQQADTHIQHHMSGGEDEMERAAEADEYVASLVTLLDGVVLVTNVLLNDTYISNIGGTVAVTLPQA
jgi:hypothetical protein